MGSSSDDQSRTVGRSHKRSSRRRDKKPRSKSRHRSCSDSSTSSHSSSSSYKKSRKKRNRKRKKEEKRSATYERRHRHTRDVDSHDSSSANERGRDGKKSRRAKKRRKKDRHTEANANDPSSSNVHSDAEGENHRDKGNGILRGAMASPANAPRTVESSDPSIPASTSKPNQPKGPMTQQQYLELQSQIREVVDPYTGRTRWMRGTGEIVERIVSREEHSRLNQSATLGDGRGFAMDIARVAAMKRNGN